MTHGCKYGFSSGLEGRKPYERSRQAYDRSGLKKQTPLIGVGPGAVGVSIFWLHIFKEKFYKNSHVDQCTARWLSCL